MAEKRKRTPRKKRPEMSLCAAWQDDMTARIAECMQHYREKRFKYIRFGVTSDLDTQLQWHQRHDGVHWTHMYARFCTSDPRTIRQALPVLSQIDDYVSNDITYPTTLFEPPRTYYLYFLVGKRRKSHFQGLSIIEIIKEQPMTIQERIGKAVIIMRKRRCMSRRALSQRACINLNYLGTIEQGKRNVSPVIIERIALALDMRMSDFFMQVEKVQ